MNKREDKSSFLGRFKVYPGYKLKQGESPLIESNLRYEIGPAIINTEALHPSNKKRNKK